MIDELLKELIEKAQELSNNHWGDDERHLIGKGIQCMYVQAENIIRSKLKIGGWIPCSERLPETSEYMEFAPTPCMKRIEIAYMTDMVEYLIGYYDGYKWIDKRNRKIENVIAWKPFLKLPEAYHR